MNSEVSLAERSRTQGGTGSDTGKSRVLIVDDHPMFRIGIAELIGGEIDLEVCGLASDMPEALQVVASADPDLAVVDISLKGCSGIELIEAVKSRYPGIKMLVSSMYDESFFAERAIRLALGFINKQESADEFLAAVRRVLTGQIYLSPRMANRLLHSVVVGRAPEKSPIESLSNRELEVFELLGGGKTTKQIAGKLQLSPKTIETHREKIKKKLNLRNGAELNCRAVQWMLERN